jgi:hypothetical protein
MIRRGQQHKRLRIVTRGHQRGNAGGRCGVPACGLKHDLDGLRACFLELVGDEETVLLI